MADVRRRRSQNVPGPWFVDDTCIDCGTCMWMAPDVFTEDGGMSAVHRQPPEQDGDTSAALLACPTVSIGGPAGKVAFPRRIAPSAWHCGYHDRRSFGAASYLVETAEGNVLVDVPRFVRPLVQAIEEMGGLVGIALTHRDDVAGHAQWHEHFDVPRAIHVDDDRIRAEIALTGDFGTVFGLDWSHVPGHTRGHVVYGHGPVLFTGDHLAGDGGRLTAFRGACWYDWDVQVDSMRATALREASHVLPGHGEPWHGDAASYRSQMDQLVTWMDSVR